MRLRLEDGPGSTRTRQTELSLKPLMQMAGLSDEPETRTFYNPNTGVGIVVKNPGLSLLGISKRGRKRRAIRRREKDKRFEQRQIAKTERQGIRQDRKRARVTKGVKRQEGMVEVIQARQASRTAKRQAKVREYQEPAYQEEITGTMIPDYSGAESDQVPMLPAAGTDYMPTYAGVDYPNEGEFVDAEIVYDEPYDEQYEYEYEEPTGELSAAPLLLPLVTSMLPGLIQAIPQDSKVGGFLKNITGSKAGQVVQGVARSSNEQYIQQIRVLQIQNQQLRNEANNYNRQRYIYGGVALVVGGGIGYLISRR